ncbi:MAG: aldo/keto reductase [Bifidobacteriaceae bacterium]|jgi:aryl-alcohol dehydrogenase-like predicted oxidoreductase|nr:aldo/keto reductase [Bifidobacteriaceae bacterium]
MKYAQFGKTGLAVSKIAAGTWGIGGAGWGGQAEADSVEALNAMLEAGVNLIDTAPIYGYGLAEQVVGRALAGRDRSSLVIATKFGVTWPDGPSSGVLVQNGSKSNIMRELELSLKALQTSYIDVYLQHWPDTDTKASAEETFTTLQDLKDQGVIKHVGLSNSSPELIAAAAEFTAIEVLQVQHSMLERSNEPLMAQAVADGRAVMAWAPLAAGMLTGKYRTVPTFGPDDWRVLFYPFFQEPRFSRSLGLLEVLDGVAAAHQVPVAAVALNWSASNPLVTTALAGVRNALQGQQNAAALDWELTPSELEAINLAIDQLQDKTQS